MKAFIGLCFCACLFCVVGCGTDANPSYFLDMLKAPEEASVVAECLTEPFIDEGETFSIRINKQCLVDLSNPSVDLSDNPIVQTQPEPPTDEPKQVFGIESIQSTDEPDTAITLPQQVFDREAGIMRVSYGYKPRDDVVFSPKIGLVVFLTGDAALRSEQYRLLLDYFTEWNAQHPDHLHNNWIRIGPEFKDNHGNLMHPFFQIATREGAFRFLTSAINTGEFSDQFSIAKHTVGPDGIVHTERPHPHHYFVPISVWDKLVFAPDAPNSIIWYGVRVLAKNSGEVHPDEPSHTERDFGIN